MKTHQKTRLKVKCPFCDGRFFSKQSNLVAHCKKFHPGKQLKNVEKEAVADKCAKFKCDICQKSFPRGANFRNHFATQHTEKKVFENCSVCGKRFSNRSNLIKHKRLYHTQVSKSLT